jgi:hypothetical protein
MALLIALTDWKIQPNLSLGVLYVFPIFLASLALKRLHILLLAAGCALLREAFGPFAWQPAYAARLAVPFGAFAAFGMLIAELNRNRKLAVENLRQREPTATMPLRRRRLDIPKWTCWNPLTRTPVARRFLRRNRRKMRMRKMRMRLWW